MEVITNNVPRDVIYGYELTDTERKEFDYVDFHSDDGQYHEFFRYKGEVYDIGEFQIVPDMLLKEMKWWDGYISDSFFSGILVKYVDEFERVIVGRYYA